MSWPLLDSGSIYSVNMTFYGKAACLCENAKNSANRGVLPTGIVPFALHQLKHITWLLQARCHAPRHHFACPRGPNKRLARHQLKNQVVVRNGS